MPYSFRGEKIGFFRVIALMALMNYGSGMGLLVLMEVVISMSNVVTAFTRFLY